MDNTAARLYLNWLAMKQPVIYNKMMRQLPPATRATVVSARQRPNPRVGMHGLGDLTSILGDITGTVNQVTSLVGSTSQDAALVKANLQRAQQGLAPVNTLPTATTATASSGFMGLSKTAWLLIGGGLLVGGFLVLR